MPDQGRARTKNRGHLLAMQGVYTTGTASSGERKSVVMANAGQFREVNCISGSVWGKGERVRERGRDRGRERERERRNK